MKKIVLISKDAVAKHYLPAYGGKKYWKTPNIDFLAKNGTVFNCHYTSAASTAMAFYSMITGQYCYETECRDYGDERPFFGDTLFDKFKKDGYSTYMIWDNSYTTFAKSHLKIIFGKTNIIGLNIIPKIAPHEYGKFDDLTFDPSESERALAEIYGTFNDLAKKDEDSFIWIHLPHVLSGRNAYASDIDLFDCVVGYARELFGDDSIFISADHGNMDGKNGKFSYGFDVDEPAICIPLISPKIDGQNCIDYNTSNIHLYDLLNKKPIKEEFIITDTAYYCQPKRKISIIKDNYKLVYIKEKKRFQLFDLKWDSDEKYNLFYPEFYDADRMTWYSLNQRFFYPDWKKSEEYKAVLLRKYNEIWRKGSFFTEKKNSLKMKLKYGYISLTKRKRMKKIKNVGK